MQYPRRQLKLVLKGMRITLDKAASAYQILGKALADYGDVLGKDDLYWAYQNAMKRKS